MKGCETNYFGEFCNGNITRKKFLDLCIKRRRENKVRESDSFEDV